MFNKISDNDLKLLKELYPNDYEEKIKKLNDNYPIQYLIGYVDFYGNKINVDERVLIPRFETEYLVSDTIKLIKESINDPKIIDLCTGSACIAISLAKEFNTEVDALDISKDALDLASINAKENNVKINFIENDVKTFNTNKKYNVLISNPPYVEKDEFVGEETKYEPQIALFADDNGLEYYKVILELSKNILEKESIISFEIGSHQGSVLKSIASNYYPNSNIIIKKDLNNLDRYMYIINK